MLRLYLHLFIVHLLIQLLGFYVTAQCVCVGGAGGVLFPWISKLAQQSVAFCKPLNIFNQWVTAVGLKEGQLVRFSFTAHFSNPFAAGLFGNKSKKVVLSDKS